MYRNPRFPPYVQADKAKYFEKQEEAEKKNPEPARLESEMRNSKPPTGAYGSTNRNKGADVGASAFTLLHSCTKYYS